MQDRHKESTVLGVRQPRDKRDTARILEQSLKPGQAEIACKFYQTISESTPKTLEPLINQK